jgi:hypothetical protein
MSTPPDEVLTSPDSSCPYRATLSKYSPSVLRGIRDHLELQVSARSPHHLVKAIDDYLREPAHRAAALNDLPSELRPVLGVLPYLPVSGWRLEELREVLRYVGCPVPEKAILAMLGLGLLALVAPNWQVETLRHFDLALNGWEGEQLSVVAHPALEHQFTTSLFGPSKRGLIRDARNERESDGLELLLRVAVLWERIAQTPLRLTQDSALFKRDKERLCSDSVLTAPMFDELVAMEDVGHLSMVLGKHLHLLVADSERESLRAHLGADWQASLSHLQRRIWRGLMSARSWSDANGDHPVAPDTHRLPAKRWAALLRLASLESGTWISLSELDRELQSRDPDRSGEFTPRGTRPLQIVVGRETGQARGTDQLREVSAWLQQFLLGAMYQLGAVTVAEHPADGNHVVQLTPLGRWLLGHGPQPPDPPVFEKTLFVQPNHEVVVYRQGLCPELIGQLASFCRWKGLGAALTLELTPESVYRGLELGRTAEEMIGILERHSQRPVPPAVADSIRTWSGRRERLRLYSQCTVLEFATAAELDDSLARGVSGDRLSDRLLLIVGDGNVPFDQFRLAGVRDYRHPPTICVDADEDGITWGVDLARSDLLVERELARFAEPVAQSNGTDRLRYRITPASLAAAARLGLRAPYLREWFEQRAGRSLPPSVELMLQASSRSAVELTRMIVLQTTTPAVAEGILQHPSTKTHILRRIGPTALAVSADRFELLKATLLEMGVEVSDESAS